MAKDNRWGDYITVIEKSMTMSWEILEAECRRKGIPLLERDADGLTQMSEQAEKILDRHYTKIFKQLINNQ